MPRFFERGDRDGQPILGNEISKVCRETGQTLRSQLSTTREAAWHGWLNRIAQNMGGTGEMVKELTGISDAKDKEYKGAQRNIQRWLKGRTPKWISLERMRNRLDAQGKRSLPLEKLMEQHPGDTKKERQQQTGIPPGKLTIKIHGEIQVPPTGVIDDDEEEPPEFLEIEDFTPWSGEEEDQEDAPDADALRAEGWDVRERGISVEIDDDLIGNAFDDPLNTWLDQLAANGVPTPSLGYMNYIEMTYNAY